jgi:menaquinone-9 beta-reductase
MQHPDVLVVGCGPAGVSTAMHLLSADPSWRERMLIVDKATFPREKLCAGGLTRLADHQLAGLGLELGVPSVSVRHGRIRVGGHDITFSSEPAFRVTHRPELDHWLVREALARGIDIRQGERVLDVRCRSDGIWIRTSAHEYLAKVVVGADGTNSLVRTRIGLPAGRSSRALEVVTPEPEATTAEHRDRCATFDFGVLRDGLQGYYWDFPSRIAGSTFVNRGVFDSQAVRRRLKLAATFERELNKRQRTLEQFILKGAGIRWYQPLQRISSERVLLAGDAAGTDPLFGEGISFALAYGELAGRTIRDAFARGDFGFRDYRWRVLCSPWGRDLLLRRCLAGLVHRRAAQPLIRGLWAISARWLENQMVISPARIPPPRGPL